METAVKRANANGRKLGYQIGFKEGYDLAWSQFARVLDNLAKQQKWRRSVRVPRRCHRCLKEE